MTRLARRGQKGNAIGSRKERDEPEQRCPTVRNPGSGFPAACPAGRTWQKAAPDLQSRGRAREGTRPAAAWPDCCIDRSTQTSDSAGSHCAPTPACTLSLRARDACIRQHPPALAGDSLPYAAHTGTASLRPAPECVSRGKVTRGEKRACKTEALRLSPACALVSACGPF